LPGETAGSEVGLPKERKAVAVGCQVGDDEDPPAALDRPTP